LNASSVSIQGLDMTPVINFTVNGIAVSPGVVFNSNTPKGTDSLMHAGNSLIRAGTSGIEVSPNSPAVVGNDLKTVTLKGAVTVPQLAGSGNAYACLNASGQLSRSATPCN